MVTSTSWISSYTTPISSVTTPPSLRIYLWITYDWGLEFLRIIAKILVNWYDLLPISVSLKGITMKSWEIPSKPTELTESRLVDSNS